MTHKLNAIIALLLFGLFTVSCSKDELEDALSGGVAAVDKSTADGLLFSETFESPAPLYMAHGTEFAMDYTFSVVDSPAFMGSKAARFELRDTDPKVGGGTRAEVTIIKDSVQKEMWYSFAVYFPAEEYTIDSEREIISQWWQTGDIHLGEDNTSPATSLQTHNDRFVIDTGYNDALVSDGVIEESRQKIDIGAVTKDTWHLFVIHFVHSYQADGLMEVWHNGSKVLTHAGGNMYNNVAMPKWKLGIYKWEWNGVGTTDTKKRVLYYDNIKVGNEYVAYADMTPANNFPPPIDPTPSPITSLTFVNAHSDTDFRELKDGDTLSMAELGTHKLNIRANDDSFNVAGVKFVLSGAKAHANTDKAMPYALFGDNGKGNYYFGNSLPVGNYTLVATPFSILKGKSKFMGEAYTVNFTIKE